MERHEILEAMTELKLYGMRASFDEIAGKGLARRDEIFPLLTSLIRAERTHRQARSINYRMSDAKLPVLKDIDDFVFADTPVDERLVRELATGGFIDQQRNVILIGGTGTGKTHLAMAIARSRIRGGSRGRFFNTVDLVNRLEQKDGPAAPVASPTISLALTSSSSTNSATCRSPRLADSSCSTWSAVSTNGPR